MLLSLLLATRVWADSPRLVAGVLDLRHYDFDANGPVVLEGDFAFEWGAFGCGVSSTPTTFLAPGYWAVNPDVPSLQARGAGSYRARVLLPANAPALGLFGGYVMTASRLCAGAPGHTEPVAALGAPALSLEQTVPAKGSVLALLPEGDELELVVDVANHHTAFGGIAIPFALGTRRQVLAATTRAAAEQFFVLGALAIIGLSNLMLFLFAETPGRRSGFRPSAR